MLMYEEAPPGPIGRQPAVALFSVAVPAGSDGLYRVRQAIRDWLAARGVVEEEADSAVLLVNELTTNVQKYAPGPARLRLFLGEGLLRCEVVDGRRARPRLIHADIGDESGRGLQLVDTLALRWGSLPVARSKVVWFDLQVTVIPPPPSRPRPGSAAEPSAQAD